MDRTMVVTADMIGAALEAAPREHFLVAVEGAAAGWRRRMRAEPIRIGRHAGCDVQLADHQVSGQHCEVAWQPGTDVLQVRDLNSTNGTFVQGQRVSGSAPLAPGGLLRVGQQLFRHDSLTALEAAQAEQHDKDLEKARKYVEALLPPRIALGPVHTDWHFVPSAQLGGDAFGYHRLGEHSFAGYLMDICGHGAGAAMHSVSVMNVMRQRALPGVDFQEPAQVLAALNDMFQMESHDGMYFSMWYGVYDLATRRLRYASAGHHPAYLVSADRARVQPLSTRNLVIGAMPHAAFRADETDVAPGSLLHVFSDGVFEVATAQGTQWQLCDFLPLLQEPADEGGRGEAERLYRRVRAVARPGPLDDDFTALVVTFV